MLKVGFATLLLIATAGVTPSMVSGFGQAAAGTAGAAASRVVGSVVSVDGQKVAIKDQQGGITTVTVTDGTKLVQIAPGQTSLAGATPIQITDLKPGDRLLVRTQAGDGGLTAVSVVAMKQADISAQHAQVDEAWKHGVGGIVKSVDAANRTVVVASGAKGDTTIKLAPSALVKRYAPESAEYDRAQPSTLESVRAGDQLRARGKAGEDKNFMADEVVVGTFRNLSGKVTGVDASTGMLMLNDIATKQNVSVKVTSDSQLKKLDDATADKVAEGMKGGGQEAGQGEGAKSAGGLQEALSHAAAIKLDDLKKGEIVMAVASTGADQQLGAVTVVAGAEPILRASPNGSAAAMSAWSVGGGAPAQ